MDSTSAVVGCLLSIVLGLIAWIARGFTLAIAEAKSMLASHVDECNKVPKSLILEKIDNLSGKLSDHVAEENQILMRIDAKLK